MYIYTYSYISSWRRIFLVKRQVFPTMVDLSDNINSISLWIDNINSNPLPAASPQNHNTDGPAKNLIVLKENGQETTHAEIFVEMYTVKSCTEGTRNHTWIKHRKLWPRLPNNWYTNLKQFYIVLMK